MAYYNKCHGDVLLQAVRYLKTIIRGCDFQENRKNIESRDLLSHLDILRYLQMIWKPMKYELQTNEKQINHSISMQYFAYEMCNHYFLIWSFAYK